MYADDLVRVVVSKINGEIVFDNPVLLTSTVAGVSESISRACREHQPLHVRNYTIGAINLKGSETFQDLLVYATQPEVPWRDQIDLTMVLVSEPNEKPDEPDDPEAGEAVLPMLMEQDGDQVVATPGAFTPRAMSHEGFFPMTLDELFRQKKLPTPACAWPPDSGMGTDATALQLNCYRAFR